MKKFEMIRRAMERTAFNPVRKIWFSKQLLRQSQQAGSAGGFQRVEPAERYF
jgi:hypothetical protein